MNMYQFSCSCANWLSGLCLCPLIVNPNAHDVKAQRTTSRTHACQSGVSQDVCANLQQEEAVQRLTERMKAVLGPFVLRRLKSEVASQLTAKQQHERVVEMTRQQTKMYHKAVQHLRAKIGANDKGVHGVSYQSSCLLTKSEWSHHLTIITRLRMSLLFS